MAAAGHGGAAVAGGLALLAPVAQREKPVLIV